MGSSEKLFEKELYGNLDSIACDEDNDKYYFSENIVGIGGGIADIEKLKYKHDLNNENNMNTYNISYNVNSNIEFGSRIKRMSFGVINSSSKKELREVKEFKEVK